MPDLWMDVDANLAEVPVNIMPLLDDTDFKSREEAVAYNAAGLELIWHFVTTAGATSATVVTPTTGGNYDWAHQDGGMYTIEIPASGGASINNDAEGFGWFTGKATGVLPWRGPVIGFRAAALNNALIDGGDTLDVNVTEISGDSTAADNCELMFDGTGYAGGSTKLGVDTVAISGDSTAANNAESFFDGTGYAGTNNVIPTVTTLTGHTAQTGDAYAVVAHADYGNAKLVRSTTPANTLTVDASHQALALTNAVTNDAITAAAIANGAIDAATFAAGAIDAAAIATGAIDADAIADNAIDAGAIAADAITAAKIAADVTTELQSGLATAAELAKVPKSDGNVTWNATALASIQAEATDALNAYDPPTNAEMEARTLVAANYATAAALTAVDDYVDTEVAAIKAVTDKLDTALELDGAVYRYTTNALEQAPTGGGAPTVEQIRQEMDANSTKLADILTDTGTTLDTLIKDIPTVAEFEARTLVAADYTVVSDLGTVQTGDAFARLGAPAGASVSADIAAIKAQTAAIEADTQDLQTQVGTDGAGLTAVPWNAAWDAEVQSEAADALNAYDPPTKAELDSAVAPLATAAALATVDTNVDSILEDTGTTLQGELDGIQADTEDLQTQIGVAGAGLTAVPWNAAWDAEVQSEAADALNAYDPPTNAEMEARTLVAASYFDPAADTVAHVTLVDTTTTNTDMVAAAPAVGDIADAVWDEALAGHAGLGTAGATLSAASAPSAADVADAVWDEALAGHLGAGTTGASLNAAGAAGDPWLTALPGAYAAGTAGDIIGNLVTDIGALTPAVAISTTTAASVSTGALAIRTHHSTSQAISSTYAGDLSAATKLWLAVKAEKDDTDAQAVIFIEATAGLTVLAGAAYTTVAHGSLTVGGIAGAWTVTVAIDEVATGLLTAYADGMLWAECKALVAGSTVAVWDGVCDIARGIVVAVS